MGYEPATTCLRCGEPFDVYRDPSDRICEDCEADFEALDLEDQIEELLDRPAARRTLGDNLRTLK